MNAITEDLQRLKIHSKLIDKTGQLNKLLGSLSKAQGEFMPLAKESQGWHGKYTDLNTIHAMTRPILAKHGLSIMQIPSYSELVTVLGHESGQHIVTHTFYPCSKTKVLEIGADMTVMRRYALNHILNIFGDEDVESPKDKYKEMMHHLEKNVGSKDQLLKWQTHYKNLIDELRKDKNAPIDIDAKVRSKESQIAKKGAK